MEIKPLTSLRGIAAMVVVLYHMHIWLEAFSVAPVRAVTHYGYLGVDFFFVLSGFIMCHVYFDRLSRFDSRSYVEFLGNRIARIYPLHLAMTVLYALAVYADFVLTGHEPAPSNTFHSFLMTLALVQAWGFLDALPWNVPSWSISSEWFVYLLFPVCVAILGPLVRRRAILLLTLAMLGCLLLLARSQPDHSLNVTIGWSNARAIFDFMVGAGMWRLRGGLAKSPLFDHAAALAVLGIVGLAIIGTETDVLFVPLLALLVLAASLADGYFARALSCKLPVFLGKISYSIYLTHAVVLNTSRTLFKPLEGLGPMPRMALGMIAILAIIAISSATWRWIEKPSRTGLRHVFSAPAAVASLVEER